MALIEQGRAAMRRKSQKPLRESQRIRVLINGIGVHCRVRDICTTAVREVVDEINRDRAAGRRTIGLLTTVSTGHHVQIDVID